jgi:isovaleryl-CoA dehydrogenase
MTQHMDGLDALDALLPAVESAAAGVDASGAFPRPAIRALGEAGLLGLVSASEVGGRGGGMREAAAVVERLAGACASTAMVTVMHYCGTAVLEAHGPEPVRRDIAAGRHLTTLAFSEVGSRSQFWAPLGTAAASDGGVALDARKSWVTSAGEADSYVWSSRPVVADGASTLWLVPSGATGLGVAGPFDGWGCAAMPPARSRPRPSPCRSTPAWDRTEAGST